MVVVVGCEGVLSQSNCVDLIILKEEGVEAVRLNIFVAVSLINKSNVEY